jgi:putative DNA primase/helicase
VGCGLHPFDVSRGDDVLIESHWSGVRSVRAADVKPQPVDWVWKPRIAAGGITILAGVPGVGKSLLVAYLAGHGSRAGLDATPFSSLLLGAEDTLEHVVRPRLEAVGADLDRVELVDDMVSLPDQAGELDELVSRKQPRLIVIDPITAYLGRGVNSWKDDSIRGALGPLQEMARRRSAAVVLVAHLNKSQDGDPLRRIGGSVGLAAIARSALLVGRDPHDPDGDSGNRRVVAHIKSNLGEHAPSLLYAIEQHHLAELTTARLVDQGTVLYDGRDLLRDTSTEGRGAVAEACQFLQERLADGPVPAQEVETAAHEAGISKTTLRRARSLLDIQAKKTGVRWTLSLSSLSITTPDSCPTPPHAAEPTGIVTF